AIGLAGLTGNPGALHAEDPESFDDITMPWRLKQRLLDEARYVEAIPVAERILARTEKVARAAGIDPDHPPKSKPSGHVDQRLQDFTDALFALAVARMETGDDTQAERLLLRLLTVEDSFGIDYSYLIDTLYRLGLLYEKRGDLARAEPLLVRAAAFVDKAG